LSEVLAIEAQSFASPWSEKDFQGFLRHDKCVCIVAEHEERIAGFMAYRLSEARIRIFDLAVAPSYRRCGVATQMLRTLIDLPSSPSRKWISLLVRETNLAAQVFFRAHAFRAVSILRHFYAETSEDAYLMQYRRGSKQSRRWAGLTRASADYDHAGRQSRDY
jgi:ribosomal-protein-alanine N-acetyltransferase